MVSVSPPCFGALFSVPASPTVALGLFAAGSAQAQESNAHRKTAIESVERRIEDPFLCLNISRRRLSQNYFWSAPAESRFIGTATALWISLPRIDTLAASLT